MPTRADIEAATPKCPQQLGSVPQLRKPCKKPLKSKAVGQVWVCPVHGQVLTWEALVARQAAPVVSAAA